MLMTQHGSLELVVFTLLKLLATLFSLGRGGALGSAFGQSIVHTFGLYATVGMAAFIAAGYKTPLAAVVFMAETTAGHSFLIPSLIGAACAYAFSGESSASRDQRLHEVVKFGDVNGVAVRDVIQRHMVPIQADATLRSFAGSIAHSNEVVFPVADRLRPVGAVTIRHLAKAPAEKWDRTTVGDVCSRAVARLTGNSDLMEACGFSPGKRASNLFS